MRARRGWRPLRPPGPPVRRLRCRGSSYGGARQRAGSRSRPGSGDYGRLSAATRRSGRVPRHSPQAARRGRDGFRHRRADLGALVRPDERGLPTRRHGLDRYRLSRRRERLHARELRPEPPRSEAPQTLREPATQRAGAERERARDRRRRAPRRNTRIHRDRREHDRGRRRERGRRRCGLPLERSRRSLELRQNEAVRPFGRYVFGVWGGIALISGIAALIGFTVFPERPRM